MLLALGPWVPSYSRAHFLLHQLYPFSTLCLSPPSACLSDSARACGSLSAGPRGLGHATQLVISPEDPLNSDLRCTVSPRAGHGCGPNVGVYRTPAPSTPAPTSWGSRDALMAPIEGQQIAQCWGQPGEQDRRNHRATSCPLIWDHPCAEPRPDFGCVGRGSGHQAGRRC